VNVAQEQVQAQYADVHASLRQTGVGAGRVAHPHAVVTVAPAA
jgi:hypothetical protein